MVPANRLEKVSSRVLRKAKETTMGKIMETGQFAAFMAAVAAALPRDVDSNIVQGWIDNPQALQRALRTALVPPADNGGVTAEPLVFQPGRIHAAVQRTSPFVVRKSFATSNMEVRIASVSVSFQQYFGDLVEEPRELSANLTACTLAETLPDPVIIQKLGGGKLAKISIVDVYGLMLKQPKGETGALLIDGHRHANVFYVHRGFPDHSTLSAVVIVQGSKDGWCIGATGIENHRKRSPGDRFFIYT